MGLIKPYRGNAPGPAGLWLDLPVPVFVPPGELKQALSPVRCRKTGRPHNQGNNQNNKERKESMKIVKIYRFRDRIGSFRAIKDPVTDRYFELLHWRFEVAGAATATLSSVPVPRNSIRSLRSIQEFLVIPENREDLELGEVQNLYLERV